MVHTDFNAHKAKAGTGRRCLAQVLDPRAQIYTLEVSFYGYKSRNGVGELVPYTESSFIEIGWHLGKALSDYHL